jgi:hypothetical protein
MNIGMPAHTIVPIVPITKTTSKKVFAGSTLKALSIWLFKIQQNIDLTVFARFFGDRH